VLNVVPKAGIHPNNRAIAKNIADLDFIFASPR
jgi:hypothetical protein